MSASWCSSTDLENWPHCRRTELGSFWVVAKALLSYIKGLVKQSHAIKLIYSGVVSYASDSLNGQLFIRVCELQLSKCTRMNVFLLHLHAHWFFLCITAFQVNKMISDQHFWLCIQQTFPLMILMLSQTVSAPAGPFGTANILKSQCWVSVQRTVKGLFWKL